MSEFDKLKDDAEQYAKDHPQQVHEAEQDAEHAAESKLGLGNQEQDNRGQPGQHGDSDPAARQPGQDHDQDQGQDQGQSQGQGQ